MGKDVSRLRRVSEQMRRDLAVLIQVELKDPRIGLVSLTDVEITPDYSHAKIYFTCLSQADSVHPTQEALMHAAGFLRSQLARKLGIRQMPQLHFIYDASVERGVALSKIIDEAIAQDRARMKEDHEDAQKG
ncbi:MAG: 30S ribosome-binding factor RbfA [Proteobacteria bacterium]|nr:30S ribosome-binding factor RbfA [Pseudomonadota bacterium]MDE3207605.1 30S ribosome-binding factor RbfA [Pseudomonadota bacterium]